MKKHHLDRAYLGDPVRLDAIKDRFEHDPETCYACSRSLEECICEPETVSDNVNPETGYPHDWPKCPSCGAPALDGHITCGQAQCNEGSYR